MCTDVPHIIQCMEPGAEYPIVFYSEGFRDVCPVTSAVEILTYLGQLAEVKQFNAHPARRSRRVIVCVQIVLDECSFLVCSKLLINMILNILKDIICLASLPVALRTFEYRWIILPVRAIFVTQLIDNLGAQCYLYPLDCIKYKKPEFAVKLIKVINVIPTRPGDELISTSTVRIKNTIRNHIGAHPVIADILQVPLCSGYVRN